METERDYVVFTDDDGNEFELDVIDYFLYKDNEYAILVDCSDTCSCGEDAEDCECETSLYIMRVIVNEADNTEEFVPPEDEDMEALVALAEDLLEGKCDCADCNCDDCDEDCDCDDCDEDCDCDEKACDCDNH